MRSLTGLNKLMCVETQHSINHKTIIICNPGPVYLVDPWGEEPWRPGAEALSLQPEDLGMSSTSTIYWPYDIKQVIIPLSESQSREKPKCLKEHKWECSGSKVPSTRRESRLNRSWQKGPTGLWFLLPSTVLTAGEIDPWAGKVGQKKWY